MACKQHKIQLNTSPCYYYYFVVVVVVVVSISNISSSSNCCSISVFTRRNRIWKQIGTKKGRM